VSATDRWQRVRALFAESLEQSDTARDGWLQKKCGGDAELLADLRRLLAARRTPTPIFGGNAEGLLARMSVHAGDDALLDTDIGPYRLRHLLGVGGMGRVYLAERTTGDFSQKVALKLVRDEFATNEMHQRFLRERNTLARMAHPNIAQLHDGGITPGGTPYFTLEYIEGEPITRWCDERAISVRGRVSLMLKVCDAVLHAHRNLIVHRDLKPSNILVNANGEPKLLDFGIAKPLSETAASETLTDVDARPMTREYAAPEQLLGDPVTTATDIYALGILLYVLLGGHSPYRRAESGETSWIKAILEDTPESMERAVERVDAASVAASRGTTPAALKRALRGDLERIVQRALAKKASARYPTTDKLADDLRAYLAGRAIAGGTRTYRARKFLRRHWLPLAAGVVVLALIVIGSAGMAWQAHRIATEARTTETVKNFLIGLFHDADSTQVNGKEVTARELVDRGAARLDKMTNEPLLRGQLDGVLGEIYNDLGRAKEGEAMESDAVRSLEAGGAEGIALAASERERARAELTLERYDDALRDTTHAVNRLRSADNVPPNEMARSLALLAHVDLIRHQFGDAKSVVDEARTFARKPGVTPETLAECLNLASEIAWAQHDIEGGAALAREEIAVLRAALGDNDPSVADAESNLADIIEYTRPLEAMQLNRDALTLLENTLGPNDQRTVWIKIRSLTGLARRGNFDEAEQLLQQAEAIVRAAPKPNEQQLELLINHHALLEYLRGNYVLAEKLFTDLVDDQVKLYHGGPGPSMDSSRLMLALLHALLGDPVRAKRELAEVEARHVGKQIPTNWMLSRGLIEFRSGDNDAAEKTLRAALARDAAMFPGGSLWTEQVKAVLSQVLIAQHRDSEGEAEARDALTRARALFGGETVESGDLLLVLARSLERHPERYAEFHATATQSAELLRQYLGENNPRTQQAIALTQVAPAH
jgi:serine/threonine-protein kinase